MQDLEQLPLVLVEALDHHVAQRVRVDAHPGVPGGVAGEVPLVQALHRPPPVAERRIVGRRREGAQLLQLGQPPLAAERGADEFGQPRIGQPHEPAWAHPVGDVAEPVRPQLRESRERRAGQQP